MAAINADIVLSYGVVELSGIQYQTIAVRTGSDVTLISPYTIFLGILMHNGAAYALMGAQPPVAVFPIVDHFMPFGQFHFAPNHQQQNQHDQHGQQNQNQQDQQEQQNQHEQQNQQEQQNQHDQNLEQNQQVINDEFIWPNWWPNANGGANVDEAGQHNAADEEGFGEHDPNNHNNG